MTGVYGTGKTTAIEEMAEILEAAGAPYAAIDLDWLAWANVEDGHGEAGERILLRNLAAVVATYREAGITRYLLAGAADTAADLDRLRDALDMPMSVVRLTAPIEVIERRLAAHPASGRAGDLEQARSDLDAGTGEALGDIVIDSDRPVREVAEMILAWLGW